MKIAICAVPAILAAVLATGLFSSNNQDRSTAGNSAGSFRSDTLNPGLPDAPDDVGSREDAAGQSEDAGEAPRGTREPALTQSVTLVAASPFIPPGPEPATEGRATDQQAAPPRPAAEPRPEQELATQAQPHEAAGDWQSVQQRRPDVERQARPGGQREVDLDQLAREQEAQREELRQQQAQDLEQFLELQRQQFDELLEQQEQAMTAAEQGLQPSEVQGDSLVEQRDQLTPAQDLQQSYGYDNQPRLDPYPDDGSNQGTYRQPNRRGTIDIPLPGRTWRFRLW